MNGYFLRWTVSIITAALLGIGGWAWSSVDERLKTTESEHKTLIHNVSARNVILEAIQRDIGKIEHRLERIEEVLRQRGK